MDNANRQMILVAPLNWGLGHATRCIPVIRQLEATGFTPVIASDGAALQLLEKEFPHLSVLELPSYQIEYSKSASGFKWKMVQNLPNILRAIRQEKKLINRWVEENRPAGIISDNRPGVRNRNVPSIYMTHQLNVRSGATSYFTGKLHRFLISRFDQCWVPDFEGMPNLSGRLGHLEETWEKVRYLGPLSRFSKREVDQVYDLTIVLSGPEPQRTLLEDKLLKQVLHFDGRVLMVCGKVESEQTKRVAGNVEIYNFMPSDQLEEALNQSKMVLTRSGYTSVMDLARLQCKAFFIPTPGQPEQEYLAKKLDGQGYVPFSTQDDFRIDDLSRVDFYKGLPAADPVDWDGLLQIFRRDSQPPTWSA